MNTNGNGQIEPYYLGFLLVSLCVVSELWKAADLEEQAVLRRELLLEGER